MIRFLARVFRGLHYIVGISEPPPETSERAFVFAWLGGIAVVVVFCVVLFLFVMPLLKVRQ